MNVVSEIINLILAVTILGTKCPKLDPKIFTANSPKWVLRSIRNYGQSGTHENYIGIESLPKFPDYPKITIF